MTSIFSIAVFEGDGIGPEIMEPTVRMLEQLQKQRSTYRLVFEKAEAGAAHYAKSGESLPSESLNVARNADAILLSAMGLPDVRYPDGTEISPQIDLRKAFDLYAGVRPVRLNGNMEGPLRRPVGKDIDFVLIRESTEGLFHTQGTGTVTQDMAEETLRITRKTSEKLFDFAFALAEQRKNTGKKQSTVTCVDKANVFRAFAFFREIFYERAKRFPDITAEHAYVDATALWMVQKPWDFDVLVTENMFGDILSDLGAGLMGGLGLAPSADIGDHNAVFQPCHGSAPDIAGKGIANPFAMFLSAAMMLEWLGHKHDVPDMIRDANRISRAVDLVVGEGQYTTGDIGGTAKTDACAGAVIEKIGTLA